MREVKVFVGIGLDEDGIKNALNESDHDGNYNTLMFEVAHALLVDHTDDRAEVHAVDVEDVTIDSNHSSQVLIEFTTSWSSYYGCRDMNNAGDEQESECVTYTSDGHLIFNVPSPRRHASEC